ARPESGRTGCRGWARRATAPLPAPARGPRRAACPRGRAGEGGRRGSRRARDERWRGIPSGPRGVGARQGGGPNPAVLRKSTTNAVEVRMLGTRRLAALCAAGALIAVPLAGCGGGSSNNSNNNNNTEAANASTTSKAAAGGAGGSVNLSATDFKFTPSDPTVKSGDVTFTEQNNGQTAHSLEIEDVNGQDKELEGTVQPGQSRTLKLNLPPGKYEFYCPVDNHKEMGMEGEITVQ